nr:methyltransferase domain-containing protein [Pseudaestuariivita rosea]
MDAVYCKQRHIYDLTRKYYLLGRDHLIEHLDITDDAVVLEVACGTGRNLISIAQRYPQARLYGIDISSEMLVSARSAIAKNGLSHRIQLAQGDACNLSLKQLFDISAADRVVLSYSLSMIPDWEEALRQAIKVLSRDGQLHVVDFGNQDKLPGIFRSILHSWLARFHVAPRLDLQQQMTGLAQKSDRQLSFQSLYRDYARYGMIA